MFSSMKDSHVRNSHMWFRPKFNHLNRKSLAHKERQNEVQPLQVHGRQAMLVLRVAGRKWKLAKCLNDARRTFPLESDTDDT